MLRSEKNVVPCQETLGLVSVRSLHRLPCARDGNRGLLSKDIKFWGTGEKS